MHRFSEHSVNHLRSCRFGLPSKIPSGPVIVVTVQHENPSLLRDNFALFLALLLVLFNLLIPVNHIHELVYTGNRYPSQRLP